MTDLQPPGTIAFDPERNAAKFARDQLRDLFALMGVAARVRATDDAAGQPVIAIAPMAIGDAAQLGDLLLAGAMVGRVTLAPGIPVWSVTHGEVATVAGIHKRRVQLTSLSTGARLATFHSDLRAATMREIREALAHADERQVSGTNGGAGDGREGL